MKKVLFLAVLIFTFQLSIFNSLHAQGFEWVRTYTGQEVTSGVTTNHVVGSCVDSTGNLYILGEFSPYAELCGERLLPSSVITTPLKHGIVIAKLSQSGELLWHKAIYNVKTHCYAHALRMVGDSAVMAMVRFRLPYDNGYNQYENLYYLDTLLTGNDGYLMPTDSVEGATSFNAFITFDLDGNAVERHLLCLGYTDTNGNALTYRFTMGEAYPDRLYTVSLSTESFNIDSEGNIYVIRYFSGEVAGRFNYDINAFQLWSIDSGTIGAMKIVVDGTHNIFYPISDHAFNGNQQILKFSPHFDSQLDAVYVFDSVPVNTQIISFEMDDQNNLYINMEGLHFPGRIPIANSNSLRLGDSSLRADWVLKYNSNLEATGLIQLQPSYSFITGDSSTGPDVLMKYPYIDNNTNSLFVPGLVGWIPQLVTVEHFFYNDDTIDLTNQTSFWLRLDLDDLRLLSYGMIRPEEDGKLSVPLLTAGNNRVLAQVKYLYSMIFCDTTWYTNYGSWDESFVAWDYNGRDIGLFSRYNVSYIKNQVNPPIAKDSIVYLTGSIWENATFGDTTITHNQNASRVYIAKYVDPEFAHPYVHPSDRQEQSIEWNQELSFALSDSPVVLTATATSGLPVGYDCSDNTIAYVEGDRLHLVADGHAWLTATQEGDYQYFPAEPVQKLLTVGGVGIATVGADGQAKAYPNPTSGMVTLDLAEIPPTPPLPSKRPRPSDSSDVDMVLYTSPGAPFSQYECCNYPYHQRYNMKVSGSALQSHDGVVTAWLTDMQGRREEVVLTPTGPDRYTLDLTSRPPAAYLLTVTTADGRELTFRLMKQYSRR